MELPNLESRSDADLLEIINKSADFREDYIQAAQAEVERRGGVVSLQKGVDREIELQKQQVVSKGSKEQSPRFLPTFLIFAALFGSKIGSSMVVRGQLLPGQNIEEFARKESLKVFGATFIGGIVGAAIVYILWHAVKKSSSGKSESGAGMWK
jgi:uncharacterized membrane protein YeaQ/YmgE (transglycosylase-associated protein family)